MLNKYHVVLAVAAFIFNKKNELLLVKKSKNEKVDPGLWVVPGGKIEPNEPIITGLKREIKEEVNIKIDSYKWICEDVFESNGFYFHAQHFLCRILHSNITLEKNLVGFHWLKKEEINNFNFPIKIRKRIKEIFENKYE